MRTRSLFLFLLLGEDRLQDITRLGDMREVDLGSDRLGRASRAAGVRSALCKCAYLLRLVSLQRTGMGLAGSQTQLCQYVKNSLTLDFHLAREIVDTNLTHPPLFNTCCRGRQMLISAS
jgi:hypothetical protein